MSGNGSSRQTNIGVVVRQKKKTLTFIDILLQQSVDSDAPLTDDDIGEEMDTFMFGGHDTTAMAISWCLYTLGLYPSIQAKLHEELDSVLQKDLENDITMDDLKELKYLDCVLKECQRLYPSVPYIARNVTKEITIGGHIFPEGTNIGTNIFALHRDPDFFPKPEEFDPDRFLPENSGSRHPFAFIPFSAGSRNCIGQKFAMMEIKIILAHILRTFWLRSPHHSDTLMISFELVLKAAGGLKVSFSKRDFQESSKIQYWLIVSLGAHGRLHIALTSGWENRNSRACALCISTSVVAVQKGNGNVSPFTNLKADLRNRLFALEENLLTTLETHLGLCSQFQNKGLYRFYVGNQLHVIIFKAELFENILNNQKTMEKSFNYKLLHSWLGTGLLTSSGAKWKKRRRLLTPAFHFRILENFVAPMNQHARNMVQSLRQHSGNDETDIVPYSAACTLEVLLETIMGGTSHKKEEDIESYFDAVKTLTLQVILRSQTPWLQLDPIYFRTDFGRTYKECVSVVHNFTRKVIENRRKELVSERTTDPALSKNSNELGEKRLLTFIDILLQHSLDFEALLTDDDIREEVDTFMFEGHDTTAMAISWCLYLIGLHSEAQMKVQEELDDILGGVLERDITSEDLKKLKYLDRVIKECQRLYPSIPFVGRTATEEFKLGKYLIPMGANVGLVIYALHRDPDVFPKPEEFNPDRFLPENIATRHIYSYVPFSAGPRNCIGQKFASMEVKIILGHILRSFTLKSVDPRDKILLSLDVTLRSAKGLKINFNPRVS
ncbi:unnamed protein product [Ixodes hexagonus]